MTNDRLAPAMFYLRALVTGVVVALTLGHTAPARAGMGTWTVVGANPTANKGTFDVLCAIGTGCRYGTTGPDDPGIFYSSFQAAQVVRQSELEQNFHATAHGTGSVTSFDVSTGPTPFDEACWSGKRLGSTKGPKGTTLTPDVRECVKVFFRNTPSTKSSSCGSTVAVSSSPSCSAKLSLFESPPSPVDYILSISESNFGGRMQVIPCDSTVVAQCLTDTTQQMASVSGFVTFGGFDGSTSGGTRYCCK